MDQENDKKDMNSYLEDLSTIKDILEAKQPRFPIATWAFFSYAGLSALGTLLSLLVFPQFLLGQHLLYIWAPLFFLGISSETIAWVQKSKDTKRPLLEKSILRLFASMFTLVPGVVYISIAAVKAGFPIPSLVFFVVSGILTLMGVATGFRYGLIAGTMSALGIAFFHLNPTSLGFYLFTGLFSSFVFALQGILIAKEEKSNE